MANRTRRDDTDRADRERAIRARPADSLEAEGVPDLLDTLPGKEITGDPQEGISPPGIRPHAATAAGTTAAEQLAGRSLDERLAEEQVDAPDRPVPTSTVTGRLVDATDDEGHLAAREADLSAADLAAEEDAVHVIGDDADDRSV